MRCPLAFVLFALLIPVAARAGEMEEMAENLRRAQSGELDPEPRWGQRRTGFGGGFGSEERGGGGRFTLGLGGIFGGSWSADRFLKIARGEDWSGEHILFRDHEVTAFLDISDPAHPKFSSSARVDEELARAIPVARRAHILVTPNVKHEGLSGMVNVEEVESTAHVMRRAQQLVTTLGLKNARVYVNGYAAVRQLHVHVVGERERGSAPYPRLTSPTQGRTPTQSRR